MPSISLSTADKVLQYTAVAANCLQDVASTTQIPFLDTICTLSSTIIPIVQGIKFQKDRCISMVEGIHQLLCALMSLCVHSDDIRSPKILNQIALSALTLQKFHSCLRAQREFGTIKRIFRQTQIIAELDSCEAELKATLEKFTMEYGIGITSALVEFTIDTEQRHQELLELIASQSGSVDNASSIGRSSLNASSGSLSLLPAYPKIFHGREAELTGLVDSLVCDPARVAILGPGGMGKTTLAQAAVHEPVVMEKYSLRHFVSCESANTVGDLMINIALHLGLELSSQLSKAIIRHLGQCGPCLMVLDNFETPWEAMESRGQVEDFLSLLADIPSLALLITIRGAERPGKVKWNRPFLPPLEPLPLSASRQIFLEVADEPGTGEDSVLNDLLELSGSLPLAISLMANIASFEGYSNTLARWHTENTALISDGHNKRSNLEKSITLSLSSPRISSSPHAMNLLSLLSLLPDGIRPRDILTSKVPIPDVRQCQSVLIGTSLAYIDIKGRLKTLSPVGEYIRRVHPPLLSLSKPLRTYFQELLELWNSTHQLPSGDLAPDLVSNLGNINQLILEGLSTDETSAWIDIGNGIISLATFSMTMLKGNTPLFQKLPHLIETAGDETLRWKYAGIILSGDYGDPPREPEVLIEEGVQHFNTGTHPVGQAVAFYNKVVEHYMSSNSLNVLRATEFQKRAFLLAQQAHDIDLQLACVDTEQYIAYVRRDPSLAIKAVQKAREIAGIISASLEYTLVQREAWAHCEMGNPSRALELTAHAEGYFTSIGMEDSNRYLGLLDIRGNCHFDKTEYLEARQIYAEVVQKTSPTHAPRFYAHSLCWIATLDVIMEGEVEGICSALSAAEAVYVSFGSPRTLSCARIAAELQLYRGDTENARIAFLDCLSKSWAIYPDVSESCVAALSDPAHRMHGTVGTFRWAVVYLALVQKKKNPIGTVDAIRHIADLYAMLDDEDTALNLFRAALAGGTKIGIHRIRAECMVGIGDIMLRRGDPIRAKEMWEAAQPLFVRSSRRKAEASVQGRLEQLSHIPQHTSPSHAIHKSTASASVTDGDTATVHSALEKLEALSAPNVTPSPHVESVAAPADGRAKVPVL